MIQRYKILRHKGRIYACYTVQNVKLPHTPITRNTIQSIAEPFDVRDIYHTVQYNPEGSQMTAPLSVFFFYQTGFRDCYSACTVMFLKHMVILGNYCEFLITFMIFFFPIVDWSNEQTYVLDASIQLTWL